MRILHIVPSLTISSGGPVKIVTQLCQELKSQGIEVAIATTRAARDKNLDTTFQTLVTPDSIPIYYFAQQFSSFLPAQFAFSWGLGKWLHQHTRDFDLLHIHYLFTYPSTIAAYYANRHRIPYIVTPLGMLSDTCLKKSAFKKKFYTLFFEKRNLTNASAIHFASEGEMSSAKKFKLNNQYVVPYGLNLEKFEHLDSLQGVFRKHYPQIGKRKIILFLSRIDPIKGLDLLIPALKILSKKNNDFVFVLAGSGPKNYEGWVKNALANAGLTGLTIFTGFLEDKMRFVLLADADIFVLSSYHENFGMAVAEAMAAGIPAVISNRVNIYKLIEDYEAGIITGLDSQEIAMALEKLLLDGQLRLKMGANGKRLMQENLDVQKTARQMREIYSHLVS